MSERLFDPNVVRSDEIAATGESVIEFLERSSWASSAAVRALLESWVAAYPASDRGKLLSRLKAERAKTYRGAWWELYLTRLVDALGFMIDEIEPEIPGQARRPDFRLTAPRGGSILLEATTCEIGIVTGGDRHALREGKLFDGLDKVRSDCFYVGVGEVVAGPNDIAIAPVRRRVERWLEGLDPAAPAWEDPDHSEPLVIERHGWHVELLAYRYDDWANPAPKDGDRLIGVGAVTAGAVNTRSRIAAALDDKALRYGRPDEPYVIALLAEGHPLRDDDMLAALLGSMALRHEGRRGSGRWVRKNDGLWHSAAGPRNTQVSAILVGNSIFPWSVAEKAPVIWPNPWADHPVPLDPPCSLEIAQTVPGNLTSTEHTPPGRSPAEILDLELGWPGDD